MAHAIEVKGLTKRFGPVLAVDQLSFTADEGRVVGFLGPNGAGKTTTLRMLLGLVNPTAGDATVHGRPTSSSTTRCTPSAPCSTAGCCTRAVPAATTSRRWPRPSGISDARVEELLELVALKDAGNRRAGGYSLGMRQRLGLAAALLGDPRVLVLDEPANGLDPQGIRWLRDFLRSLAAEGRAVLVSSHVLAEVAQTADDVVVIARGRSVAQAPLAEIMARGGGGMRVEGPDVARVAELLDGQGAKVSGGRAEILVSEVSGEQIGRLVAEHQLVISELSPRAPRWRRSSSSSPTPREARHDPLIASELFKLRTHADVLLARRRRARARAADRHPRHARWRTSTPKTSRSSDMMMRRRLRPALRARARASLR